MQSDFERQLIDGKKKEENKRNFIKGLIYGGVSDKIRHPNPLEQYNISWSLSWIFFSFLCHSKVSKNLELISESTEVPRPNQSLVLLVGTLSCQVVEV